MLYALRFVVAAALAALCLAGSASAGPSLFFGFNDDAPKWEGSEYLAPAFDLGAKSMRLSLRWSPGKTALTATEVSELTNAMSVTSGMRIILGVWGERAVYAPADATAREQYCTYVRGAVQRFPSINDVIVWNEPNLSGFWQPQFNADGTSASPAAYQALLARCYDVLHAFRSRVNVIGPATSPAGNDMPNATSNISHSPGNFATKLADAYRASGRTAPIFDTVAQHAYGATPPERPWKTHAGGRVGQGDYDKLMGILRTGYAGTAQPVPGECVLYRCVELWWLEHGWQTAIDSHKASLYTSSENVLTVPDWAGGDPAGVTPSADSPAPDQATQAVDSLRLAYCQPYVGAIFNFLVRDELDLRRWQSGVVWADMTPKDSYPHFKSAIAEVHGKRVNCAALKGGPATATPDVTAPAPPMGLTARRSFSRYILDWPDSLERDVAGFNVYRSTNYGFSYTKRNTALVKQSAYTDSVPYGMSSVSYYVTAVDTSDNESQRSNVARPF